MTKEVLLMAMLIGFSSKAQVTSIKELDSIVNVEEALAFIESKNTSGNKIITFNEEKHKTKLSQDLLKMDKGGSKIIDKNLQKIHYKVLEKNKVFYYRFNYVLFDGTEMSSTEINQLQKRIIAKLNAGVPFKYVADEYSIDLNKTRGGDSGWVSYGEMPIEIEQQLMNNNHQLGDLFSVNIESEELYYVVKKSYDKKSITEIKVLKVIENLD